MELFLHLVRVNSSTFVFLPLSSFRLAESLTRGQFFPLEAITTETTKKMETTKIMETTETIKTTKTTEITETTKIIDTQIIKRQKKTVYNNNACGSRQKILKKERKQKVEK